MGLVKWIAKRNSKEIIKGVIQAVKELLEELLTSKVDSKSNSTSSHQPPNIKKKVSTDKEVKEKAHDILSGSR